MAIYSILLASILLQTGSVTLQIAFYAFMYLYTAVDMPRASPLDSFNTNTKNRRVLPFVRTSLASNDSSITSGNIDLQQHCHLRMLVCNVSIKKFHAS